MHYLDYNEQRQHGTEDFPLDYYYVDEHHPRYRMPFHWHKETELMHVVEGQLHLYLDDREYLARAGDLFYIHEGVIHGGEPENCIYECVVFDPTPLLMHTHTIRRYLRKPQKHQILIREHFTRAEPELLGCATLLYHTLREKSPGWEMTTLGALFELYGIIFKNEYYTSTVPSPEGGYHGKMNQLKPVLEYIENHYAANVTLEELAHFAGMSPKYFCRFFHAVIHRTPIDYLNYYRIERACFLMDTEELSVTETAYRCGFNDSSYFVRAFKKYKGITPKQYARRLGKIEL